MLISALFNTSKTDAQSEGFFDRMIAKVVNNIQIFVDKVHIRYEDDPTSSSSAKPNQSPFSFGITLSSFHAQTTDEQWKPTFLQETKQDYIYKVLMLTLQSRFHPYPNDAVI